jgi:hypothetical protein
MIQSLTGSRFSENLSHSMALDEAVQEYVSYLDFIQVSRSWPGELVSHVDVANQAAAVFQDITFLIDQIELPEA